MMTKFNAGDAVICFDRKPGELMVFENYCEVNGRITEFVIVRYPDKDPAFGTIMKRMTTEESLARYYPKVRIVAGVA